MQTTLHKSGIDIQELKNGGSSNKAWNALVEYLPKYLKYRFRGALSETDIEDAAQKTAVIVFQSLHTIETVKYIETIAYHEGVRMIRETRKREGRFLSLDECDEKFDENQTDFQPSKVFKNLCIELGQADQAHRDAKDRITEICSRLSQGHRAFVGEYLQFLKEGDQSSTERRDFARDYGYTESGVNTNLYRIRAHLKSLNVQRV